jgi:hypothetical protein
MRFCLGSLIIVLASILNNQGAPNWLDIMLCIAGMCFIMSCFGLRR